MSYDIFKQNMLVFMRNQSNIASKEQFAKRLVEEYDALIKRGFDTINGIKLQQGNTAAMEQVLIGVLNTAFQQSSGEHAIITNMGKAFQAYWTPIASGIGGSLIERVATFIDETFRDSITLKPEEKLCLEFASNLGYSGMESTGIGITVGGEVIKGNVKTENLSEVIPEKKRSSSDTREPYPNSGSTKVQGCGRSNVPNPPPILVEAMKKFKIDTPIRRAHFLAQCALESGGFKWVREFASGAAYEGRLDLGNTQPGDGKKFKGRGYIQLTGRANYTRFNGSVTQNVIQNPLLVEDIYRADASCWFWAINDFNSFANDDLEETLKRVTKRVNGGYNGYEERKQYFCGYWELLQQNPELYT